LVLPVEYTDLDALIGSWQEDAIFERALAVFECVDEEAWSGAVLASRTG